ncbi:hypothetical protein SUGI_0709210 [Cryptomeria japonica]|nr:hypothetical protein SUGI_0709210 [Cryptomeria japonica]
MASMKLLKSERVIGDVVDDFTPTVKMNVVYDSNTKVTNGFEPSPSAVSFPPQVEVDGDIDKFYTLIMTDPDYPGPCEPFWREYLLWYCHQNC